MYGLGFALQTPLPPCNTITTPAGFVGPIECDPTDGGPVYAVEDTGGAAGNNCNLIKLGRDPFAMWLNCNALRLGLGALAGLLVLSIARGGRR